ncbi:hypothetical protein HK102_005624 [Quaeritorhiza haematococci]|nr:hypothetical protein HK102_005624 [Quaeritorhiza haematococci]
MAALWNLFPVFYVVFYACSGVLSVSTSVFLTEILVNWFENNKRGPDNADAPPTRPPTKLDLQSVQHTVCLFGAMLVGPVITAILVSGLLAPMQGKMIATWLLSSYIGNVLTVPFVLLIDEIPVHFMRHGGPQQTLWAYAVLLALNLLYVVLRLVNAADTQLGIYLTFPWLMLMTHMFGPAGAYTGCFLTGFINLFTAAYLDDIDRVFWLHGHVLILIFTCVGFIEVFRQRDEALNNVERIVEERTHRLKSTMTRLVDAEKKALTAFDSRTQFMDVLCKELPSPLLQIINLAKSIRAVDVNGWVNRVDGIVKNISRASTYITKIINEMLELGDSDLHIQNGHKSRMSVGHAAFCLSTRFANAFVSVVNHLEAGVDYINIPLSEEQFSKMVQRLISYARGFVLDHHVTLTVHANAKVCLIQTSHHGSVTHKNDLLELALPFSTHAGATSSWATESAQASRLSLCVVRIIVEQVGGRIHLKSIVRQHRIVVTIILPLCGFVLPPGDVVQVQIDRSPSVFQSSRSRSMSQTGLNDPAIRELLGEGVSAMRN